MCNTGLHTSDWYVSVLVPPRIFVPVYIAFRKCNYYAVQHFYHLHLTCLAKVVHEIQHMHVEKVTYTTIWHHR